MPSPLPRDKRYSSQLCCGLVQQTERGFRAYCNKCLWEGADHAELESASDEALWHPRTPRPAAGGEASQ